jgi:hypothetical protein
MRTIHYFQRYSQPENVITNNTLLLLVRLHEFSRLKFERVIEKLCEEGDAEFSPQWLQFSQQVKASTSVIDGFIAQESVKIAVETKRHGAFSVDQMERHLELFSNEQNKLLILLSPTLDSVAEEQFRLCKIAAEKRGIEVVHTSFESLIKFTKDQLSDFDEEMVALLEDFELFCSELGLLPTDEYKLFVPPCRHSRADNEEFHLYYCPADRPVRKAKYLGIYADRCIWAIGRISKILVCSVDLSTRSVAVIGSKTSLTEKEQSRILGATERATDHKWNIALGHRFYLCDEWEPTEFRKSTHGGIMGHRLIDLREVLGTSIPKNTGEIAKDLQGRTWGKST